MGGEITHGFDFVLNVDGSSQVNLGRAGFGTLLRTGDKTWVSGVYDYIGESSNLKVEIFCLLFGLELA